jgi:hypothetical protein
MCFWTPQRSALVLTQNHHPEAVVKLQLLVEEKMHKVL